MEGPQISALSSEPQFLSNASAHAMQDSDSDSGNSTKSIDLVCSDEDLSVELQMLEAATNADKKGMSFQLDLKNLYLI